MVRNILKLFEIIKFVFERIMETRYLCFVLKGIIEVEELRRKFNVAVLTT